ncbi:hypothetical protein A7979_10250 [Rothia nasimurium]|uniref:ABC transporter domain-containing protein n=1 Tax=Rothia nasimurium TaxID=85336 RepID=A0A1Y1RSY8_9MICC|nr:ATP-binding cassette domain-containing protein [Rothia nasimurium]ORC24365.1 hypothetical protein A7979_10250 [Rothia nasimurium]
MSARPLIETREIRQQFGSDDNPLEILHGINLTIQEGEVVALLGTSGSGKSTLLNILGLLAQASSGSYTLGGTDISEIEAKHLADIRLSQVGFVFQSFHLIAHKNVLENVELPLLYQGIPRDERRRQAQEVIDRLGLSHRATAPIETLSGGEKQRVAIARAVVTRPTVLLCDEPTGALDQKRSHEVMDLLREVTGEKQTTLVVTHDPAIAARCDRSFYIEDGMILEVGQPASHTHEGQKQIPQQNTTSVLPAPAMEAQQETGILRETTIESLPRFPWVKPALIEAWQSTFARLRRNFFTMLGVALGVAALTLTVGLSNTIAGQVSDAFDIYQAKKVTLHYSGQEPLSAQQAQILVDSPSYQKLTGLNGVTGQAAYRVINDVMETQSSLYSEISVSAPVIAAQETVFAVQEQNLVQGRLFDSGHNERGETVAVVGQSLLKKLGVNWQEGLVIYLEGTPVTVIGVVTENSASGSYYGAVYLPLGTTTYPESTSFDIVLRVQPGAAQQVGQEAPYAVSPNNPAAYSASVPPAPETLKKAVNEQQKALLIAMSLITLVIGAVGTMNTFLVGVMERRQEIGLRLAIGTKPAGITLQLAVETIITSLLGSFAGLIVSINAIALISLYNSWTPIISPAVIGMGAGVGLVLGTLAGIYPARKASQIDPIESLARL